MNEFNTTLLREKFVIRDPDANANETPVTALSNRIVVPLPLRDDFVPETFVIRAQNMHSCVRMAAKILHVAQEEGPVYNRVRPFDWKNTWLEVTDGYEKKFNPKRWVSVYFKGKPVFFEGERHPFLDIIEACDTHSKSGYKDSVTVAESAFKQAGKVVKIEYDSNVALVVSIRPDLARCGIILRGADRTTTFNFTARPEAGRTPRPSQCLTVSAAFLEGIQLSFQVGMGREKLHNGLIERHGDDQKQIHEGEKRLARLNAAIKQFEQMFDVAYRAERPDFFKMTDESQQQARKILAPRIAAQIASGELDESDWVM